MAKVQITITDKEGEEGAIRMDYKFDPELPQVPDDKGELPLSPAQTAAMSLFYMLQNMNETQDAEETTGETESQKEGCSEPSEEGTCCGGACNNS